MVNDHRVQLTQQGYDELVAELEELTNTKIPAAISRVALARSQGDLRENSEYHAAREELAMLEGRRDELDSLIQRAEIIVKVNNGVVSLGSEVEVEIDGNGSRQTFSIVGEWEANPREKKISEKSPLGQALTGKKAGEVISIEAPAGTLTYHIYKVK
jgi:transcription elongation factor GreA